MKQKESWYRLQSSNHTKDCNQSRTDSLRRFHYCIESRQLKPSETVLVIVGYPGL